MQKPVKKIGDKYKVKCVQNKNAEKGMSESLKLGVRASNVDTDAYMFFVGDQVFLNHDIIDEIIGCYEVNAQKIIVPRCKSEKTNPVCFPSAYRNQLLSLEGDSGGRQIIQKQKEHLKFLEIPSKNLCLDLDTEDDLVEIKKLFTLENELE